MTKMAILCFPKLNLNWFTGVTERSSHHHQWCKDHKDDLWCDICDVEGGLVVRFCGSEWWLNAHWQAQPWMKVCCAMNTKTTNRSCLNVYVWANERTQLVSGCYVTAPSTDSGARTTDFSHQLGTLLSWCKWLMFVGHWVMSANSNYKLILNGSRKCLLIINDT